MLAVAFRDVDIRPRLFDAGRIGARVLAGFLRSSILRSSASSIRCRRLGRDGIGVKVLTGDSDSVGPARLRQGRLGSGPHRARRGDRRAQRHGSARRAQFTIFGQGMLPAQKHRVVTALQGRGHVVGIPRGRRQRCAAASAADIGISVVNATDIAGRRRTSSCANAGSTCCTTA